MENVEPKGKIHFTSDTTHDFPEAIPTTKSTHIQDGLRHRTLVPVRKYLSPWI